MECLTIDSKEISLKVDHYEMLSKVDEPASTDVDFRH